MTHPVKAELHPRNKHNSRYNLKELSNTCPELTEFIQINKYNDESIDFKNPDAVKALNKALLEHFYGVKSWDIPKNYLCPPIPGRADYLHYMADLLASVNKGIISRGASVRGLDIGVGANCVYPLIGHAEYGWSFVGSDIDPIAINSSKKILQSNPSFGDSIELRLQKTSHILKNVFSPEESFDFTTCNPPFHSSLAEASQGSLRKWKNLRVKAHSTPVLNFGGQGSELWCEGGEKEFITKFVLESKAYSHSCLWFSCLVSKEENLAKITKELKNVRAVEIKTLQMSQGQKKSRVMAWSFLDPKEQSEWAKLKWIKEDK